MESGISSSCGWPYHAFIHLYQSNHALTCLTCPPIRQLTSHPFLLAYSFHHSSILLSVEIPDSLVTYAGWHIPPLQLTTRLVFNLLIKSTILCTINPRFAVSHAARPWWVYPASRVIFCYDLMPLSFPVNSHRHTSTFFFSPSSFPLSRSLVTDARPTHPDLLSSSFKATGNRNIHLLVFKHFSIPLTTCLWAFPLVHIIHLAIFPSTRSSVDSHCLQPLFKLDSDLLRR